MFIPCESYAVSYYHAALVNKITAITLQAVPRVYNVGGLSTFANINRTPLLLKSMAVNTI